MEETSDKFIERDYCVSQALKSVDMVSEFSVIQATPDDNDVYGASKRLIAKWNLPVEIPGGLLGVAHHSIKQLEVCFLNNGPISSVEDSKAPVIFQAYSDEDMGSLIESQGAVVGSFLGKMVLDATDCLDCSKKDCKSIQNGTWKMVIPGARYLVERANLDLDPKKIGDFWKVFQDSLGRGFYLCILVPDSLQSSWHPGEWISPSLRVIYD